MIRFDDILDKIADRFGEKDIAFLQKAYVFTARAHGGQVRRSGEPYLGHPLEVTAMLADMGLDRTTLAAALLHDVLEDTPVTAAALRETFGKEVAGLVEAVTKISRVQETSPEVRRAETIRKIILAMTDDLRVIFIKLADRLHNLQTLKFLPEAGQRRIAAETLEIYAPIANRLGMGRLKAELEDLAFRYVNPEEYFRVAALVEPRRKAAESELKKLRRTLDGLLKENHIPAEIVHRLKRLYSIHRKMEAQRIEFHQVYDFLALRIITDTAKNCYAVLGLIHNRWTHIPYRFRDFIAMPKPNLYQALHTTIVTEDKLSVEIQIRTRDMHDLAENGIAAHWRYKDDGSPNPAQEDKRLVWLRELAELFSERKNPKEFIQNLKINLRPEEVYVLSPTGRVEALPAGASALDFAFRIHSEIGLHAAGARINGRPAPLKTVLHTGDIVEIQTVPERGPARSWLNMAFTSGARQQIKRWLGQRDKGRSVMLGRKLWEKEWSKYEPAEGFPSGPALLDRFREVVRRPVRGLDDVFAQIGRGRLVLNRRFLERLAPPGLELKRKAAAPPGPEIQVKDRENALIRLSKCCAPVKGEPIVGYLTRGKGITVHALRCTRVSREVLSPERLVEVSWGAFAQDSFKAGLVIRAKDSRGLLAKVAAAVAAQGGDIAKAEVETAPEAPACIRLVLKVRDIQQLQTIEKEIAATGGVLSVLRT
jgi:guanosine-3',5'-bis(diphosphate) 3'-pyrophosphohydrolase